MDFKIIEAFDHAKDIEELFIEYTDALVEGDPEFKKYLEKQNFNEEIKHLEMKYGRPDGRLYIAYCDDEPAGCIGLKRFDDDSCEMKRLYIRPKYRGQKLGRKLAELIICEAKTAGYRRMYIDTLPFLTTAIGMYKRIGFCEIESYNGNPMENLVYLELDL